MIILATVLLGPGTEKTVADAMASCRDAVDGFIVIESGGGRAALNAVLDSYKCDGKRIIKRVFAWTGSYADGRNAALDFARHIEGGCDYAVTLDPDERLDLHPRLRALLAEHPEVPAWVMADRDTGYCKERVIRCSSNARWHGLVSENLDAPTMGKLPGHFWELPKSPEAERRRHERGVVACQKMIADGDDRFKWRRHLGSCLMALGRPQEAVEQYRAALALAQRAEDTAWVTYLICQQLVIDGDTDEARRLAAEALSSHAGFVPEFGWIFAYTDLQAGRNQNASRWAQLVLHTPDDSTRVSFRSLDAKRGAQQILASLHGTHTPLRSLRGVSLPITDRYSPAMVAAVESGQYERVEHGLLGDLLQAGDRLLELGAGCGYLATAAAKLLGSDSVVTVEADPEMEATIRRTFLANDVSPRLLVGAVARDASPRQVLRAENFWSTQTRLGGSAPSLPLGNLLRDEKPTVLLCDIEGGEGDLCGEPLPESLRAVVIETHSEDLDRQVTGWLTAQSYRLTESVERTRVFQRG